MRAPRLTLPDRAASVKLALRDPAVLGLDGLRWTGRQWWARSPWRDERTASCSIRDMADGLAFHDFGIRRGGDVLHVIAALYGVNFAKAVEIGEQLAGIVPGEAPPPRRREHLTDQHRPDDTAERFEVQRVIHRVLLEVAPLGDEGVAYLHGRGFSDDEIPTEDWCLLPLPGEQARVIDAIDAEIGRDAWRELSGLASDDGSRFKAPANRLVIPWRTGPGLLSEVAYLQRRRLDNGEPKYMGPDKISAPMPFGVEDFEIDGDGVTLVLVEGALDVLAMRALARSHDLERIVLGIPGTGGWRKEWAALGAGRDVIVALDGDSAGDDAINNIALDLVDAGACVRSTAPMHGKDWNETLVRERGGKVAA